MSCPVIALQCTVMSCHCNAISCCGVSRDSIQIGRYREYSRYSKYSSAVSWVDSFICSQVRKEALQTGSNDNFERLYVKTITSLLESQNL